MYYGQTKSVIIECLLTLRYLEPNTRGHHQSVHCSLQSKWRPSLTYKIRIVCHSSDNTSQWQRFDCGFVRIKVKNHLRDNLFTSGTSRLRKFVSLCSGRRASDETAGRVRTSFVRSPQKSTGGQEGKWVMSLARQCGGCYVRDCLSDRTDYNCCRT
jgi:hypothetical protein